MGQSITATQGATYNVVHSLSTSATTTIDEVYIYAQNNYSAAVNVVFEFGTSQSGVQITCPVAALDGPQLLIPGLILTGSACAIQAFVNGVVGSPGSASVAISGCSLISLYGYANRIVQT